MHGCCLLRGIVRSARPANIPTLFTNAAVAWMLTGCHGTAGLYAAVVLMGLCFYLYGMWENDRVDARWDAVRYPDRPVPCGEVGTAALRMMALGAGLCGLVLNLALGGWFVAGALLLIVISLYNLLHKSWAGAVVLMGLCRGLWVLCAGAIFVHVSGGDSLPVGMLWYAGGLFAFTCVISIVARREAGRPAVQAAVGVLLSGMCLFDALWLFGGGSWLAVAAVALWGVARLLQKRGVRAT